MKRKLTLLTMTMLASLSGFSQTAATEATWGETDTNIAKGAKVYVNAIHAGSTSNITDNSLTTTCQVQATGDNKDTEWVVIDLGYNYSITKISITTSGDRYDTAFNVYGAASQTNAPVFADGTDALADNWGEALVSVDNTGQTEAGQNTRTYSVSGNVRYIKYQSVTRGDNQADQYGFTMNELRVAGTTNDAEASKVASITLALPSLKVGDTGAMTVKSYNNIGKEISTLTYSDVTFTTSDGTVASFAKGESDAVTGVTGNKIGTATITATYTCEDETFSASANISVARNWAVDDMFTGKQAKFKTYASSRSGQTDDVSYTNIVGQSGLGWRANPVTETTIEGYTYAADENPTWFIDFQRPYTLEEIGIEWPNINPYSCEISIGTDTKNTSVSIADPEYGTNGINSKFTDENNAVTWESTTTTITAESGDIAMDKVSSVNLKSKGLTCNDIRFLKLTIKNTGDDASVVHNWNGVYTRIPRIYILGTPDDADFAFANHTYGDEENKNKERLVDVKPTTGNPQKQEWNAKTYQSIVYTGTTEQVPTVINLNAVTLEYLPSNIPAFDANPNAIIYASKKVDDKNVPCIGVNVCGGPYINITVPDLQLKDGYDFAPAAAFNYGAAKFTGNFTVGHYTIIQLPFNFVKPSNMEFYTISGKADDNLYISEVEDETLNAKTSYIVKATGTEGATVEVTFVGVDGGDCAIAAAENTTDVTNVTTNATFLKTTVPVSDNNTTTYMFKEGKYLAKVTGEVTLYPFAGYIQIPATTSNPAKLNIFFDNEVTGIESVDTESVEAADGQAYNMAGQPVGDGYKGFVIKNGKKYIKK